MLTNLITKLDKIVSEIETKVTPNNIREGVEIFGIEGSLPELLTQHKKVKPSVYTQVVVPDLEYTALHEVIVNAVTSAIDSNIQPYNIRYGKRILGIAGNLSSMTEEEYERALLLEIQILGWTIYVFKSNLVLNGEDYIVEDNILKTTGTVESNVLKLN